MKLLVALVLWAQLLSCKAIPLAPQLVSRIVNCDDPEAEELAHVSVDHINSHNLHGYKYALNIIKNIKILPRRSFGDIVFIELDLLETECHVLSPVPVENCTVRPQTSHAVEGDCDVKLLVLDGKKSVLSSKCHSSPDSTEDLRRLCPDCGPLAVLSDADVVNAVAVALAKFNTEIAKTYYRTLEISRAQRTHLPPGIHVEFAIGGTNCSVQEATEHPDDCHVATGELARAGFCKASTIRDPVSGQETTEVTCDLFAHQPGGSLTHLTDHHLGGNRPSPGVGFRVLDLIHSHNGTHASHESHSAEHLPPVAVIPVEPEVPPPALPATVVKRSLAAVEPQPALPLGPLPLGPFPVCPGKIRHFRI